MKFKKYRDLQVLETIFASTIQGKRQKKFKKLNKELYLVLTLRAFNGTTAVDARMWHEPEAWGPGPGRW